MKLPRLIALACAVCHIVLRSATAQVYLTKDTSIDQTFLFGSFVAGYADLIDQVNKQNGTSPSIKIIAGAHLAGPSAAFNGSTINMSGGDSSFAVLNAHDTATINFSGGNDNNAGGGLRADGHGVVNMSGGSVATVFAAENGSLNLTGGLILTRVQTTDSSTGLVSGITIGNQVQGNFVQGEVITQLFSTLELSNTVVGLDATAFHSSHLNLTNSTIHQSVFGRDLSTLTIVGGSVGGGVQAYNLNMAGGTVGGGVAIFGAGAVGTVSGTQMGGGLIVGQGPATLSVTGVTAGGASAFESGTLRILNSTINGAVNATGSASGPSLITINGGKVSGSVSAIGAGSITPNSTIVIDGTTVTGMVTANTLSSVTLVDGVFEKDVESSGASNLLLIQGGNIAGRAVAFSSGSLTMSGGTVAGELRAASNSIVTLSGGTVQRDLIKGGGATLVVSGGVVGGEAKMGSGSFTMTGGKITGKTTIDNGTFSIQNGTIGGDLSITTSGTISGGSVGGNLIADEFSDVQMSGGQIKQELIVTGNSNVNISGGQILQQLSAGGHSTVGVSGGSLGGGAVVGENGTLKVSGTALVNGQLNAFNQSTLDFSGGSAQSVGIAENATLNMSGSALVLDKLEVFDSGKANINGGKVNGILSARGSSATVMTAGQVLNAEAIASATLTVQGGAIGGKLISHDSSVVSLTGGSVSGDASAQNGSKLLINGTAFIGGKLEATSNSTVIIAGGGVAGNAIALDTAKLNITGSAFIAGDLTAFGKSALAISGGSLAKDVGIFEDTTLEVSGGSIAGTLFGHDRAAIAMTGGVVGRIVANGDVPTAGFTIGGGQVLGNVTAFNNSGILIAGGSVSGLVRAQDNSRIEIESVAVVSGTAAAFNFGTIEMSGGTVGVGVTPGNLEGHGNSTVTLSSGTVGGNLICLDNSTVTMSGGTVFGTAFKNQCHFSFGGGKILGGIQSFPGRPGGAAQALELAAADDAVVTIYGGNLTTTLVDPNFAGKYSKYQLTGVTADGTSIDGGFLYVQNGTQANFHLRPGGNWKIDSGGSWDVGANWASNVVPDEAGALAQLLGVLSAPNAPANVTLEGNRTVGSLTFDNANAYVIQQGSGGTLTLNNLGATAEITVRSGNHQIMTPVIVQDNTAAFVDHNSSLTLAQGVAVASGKTLTKDGVGVLSAAFVRGGSLSVQAGKLNIIADGTNAGVSKLDSLAISAGAALDLNNNDLVVQGGASALAGVSVMIGSARNGAGGLWTGDGLTSSAAANDVSKLTGLAVVLNDNGSGTPLYATFDGQSVDVNSVLVKYTYNGDMDLNGVVDADDYFRIDRGFAKHLSGYANGDLDFTGSVDADDYFLIDKAFVSQTGVLAGESPLAAAAVPEPSSAWLLGAGLMGLLNRRRHSAGYRVSSGSRVNVN